MEKIFIKLHSSTGSLFVNVNHIVCAKQNGTGTVVIELSNGTSFEDNRAFTQWEALMEQWIYKPS